MIVMAIMVGLSAILGSVAMGMLFDGNNIPEDLMRNGAYQAFQMLGNSWGVGNLFVVYLRSYKYGRTNRCACLLY